MPARRADHPASSSRRRLVAALGGCGVLGVTGLMSACSDADDEVPEVIASGLTTTTPDNQAATYRNIDRLYATRAVGRGATIRTLPAHATSLNALRYDAGAGPRTVADYMAAGRTGGLLILKDGKVALERYAMGNTERSLWTSFSVAKSLTSTLIGVALQEGRIRSLDDTVADYVPALRSSAYAACPIRSLLRMSSGVGWTEDYAAGASDIAALVQAFSSSQPGAVLELMRSRPRAAPVGSAFNYSTGESYVLGAVLAGAIDGNLGDYAARKVWDPAGMEADGYWMLDAPGGLEMGGNNFSATLRDYGRLGLFMLEGGGGASRLPNGWRTLAGQPDNPVTAHGLLYPDYPLGYGYQWWSFPDDAALAPHQQAFTAQGIYGQFIYINPVHRVVAVVWSAWPEPWVDALEFETYALLGTAVAALAG
jgi:CubicO group peptidase (beta-lactamase class C family)